MTLWNPMNVSSSQPRPAVDEPSASFDPSRTGDPLGPGQGNPAIGIGGTSVDGTAVFGDPRRHPIGFAPSEERTSVTRYRTEISFKRHHEQPRASATPGQADSPEPAPSIPEVVVSDAVLELDESTGAAEATPFYKREISFRRKRETSEEAAAVADAGESDAVGDAEAVEHADDDEEPAEAVAEQDASSGRRRRERFRSTSVRSASGASARLPREPRLSPPPSTRPRNRSRADRRDRGHAAG